MTRLKKCIVNHDIGSSSLEILERRSSHRETESSVSGAVSPNPAIVEVDKRNAVIPQRDRLGLPLSCILGSISNVLRTIFNTISNVCDALSDVFADACAMLVKDLRVDRNSEYPLWLRRQSLQCLYQLLLQRLRLCLSSRQPIVWKSVSCTWDEVEGLIPYCPRRR